MTDFTAGTTLFLNDYIGNMNRDLAIATIEQYGGEESFIEDYKNVMIGGINCGIGGFIYYVDTVKFYVDNKKKILEFAKLEAADYDCDSAVEMVKSFGLLNGLYSSDEVAEGMHDVDSESHQQIANAMTMFVGEQLARSYETFIDQNPEEAAPEDDDCED